MLFFCETFALADVLLGNADMRIVAIEMRSNTATL